MTDIVDKITRSKMMSGIRGKNTKPEIFIRKGMFGLGFRYRIHYNKLPGKPDMVFPKYKAIIFTHGCFWHGHDCPLFKCPTSNQEFWIAKINRNRTVDAEVRSSLESLGWRILIIWECAMKGRGRIPADRLLGDVSEWIRSGAGSDEIRGM